MGLYVNLVGDFELTFELSFEADMSISTFRKLLILSSLLVFLAGSVYAGTGPDSSSETGEGESEVESSEAEKPKVTFPAFQNIRVEEDWGALKDSDRQTGYEKLKFIPLNQSGSVYMSVGGQVRLRGEVWDQFGFGGSGNRDDGFGLMRVRLHSDLWFGSRFRVFVEGKSSLSTNRDLPGGLRTLDVDTADIQHLMVDINLAPNPAASTLRLGRQELQFGKQRLVSPLDWANTRRSWDAARLIIRQGGWRVDGFWSEYAAVQKYSLNCADASGIDFYGIYATNNIASKKLTLDLYWLGFERESASWVGTIGEETRQTFGARLGGSFSEGKGFFDLEGAFQTGSVGPADVRASMFAGQVGASLQAEGFKPRIYTGLDYGSGDDDPNDNKVGTFNQLFPLGHAYLGYIDIVGRQNIVDWNAGVSFPLLPKLNFAFDLHNFWRASAQDAFYNAGGGVVREGSGGESKSIGSEVDFTLSSPVNRHLVVTGGYSHFFPGTFIEESGSAEGINFLYLAVQTTF
ncbi:MAG: alginate export family protein [Acidobacteriota bacterium]|nr:MAG: alginate export family protein [Acidobacteriota bacterium]